MESFLAFTYILSQEIFVVTSGRYFLDFSFSHILCHLVYLLISLLYLSSSV